MRSLPPNLTALAWDFASADPSSNRMAAACGLPTTPRAAQAFVSPYLLKPRRMNDTHAALERFTISPLKCFGCADAHWPAGNFRTTSFFFVGGFVFLRIEAGSVLLSDAHQKTDEIVQLAGTERGSIVRRHQRIRF